MLLLTFGTWILQDWQTAGLQLIYGFAYGARLFLVLYNRYSVGYPMTKKKQIMITAEWTTASQTTQRGSQRRRKP
jgi:hypothetical protein